MTARVVAAVAVAVALSHCSKPTSPPGPAPPGAAEYRTLAAWLVRQGIAAPAEGPPAREAAREAAGKAASGARLLGDATGDGAVTFWDLWPLWQYLTGKTYMAEHYDFDLLDIDRDGDNDWDDLKHLGRFLYAAESGNPWKIGEPLAPPLRAALSPVPSELDLVADGTLWHRLDLSVTTTDGAASADTVRVRVNPADAGPPVLEIARRTRAPGNDWCAGEPNDTIKGVHGKVFWLAGCQAGDGAVEILDGDDNLLASYPVTVREPPSDDPADNFNIELVFADGFTERQRALIRQAADRWEEVITGDLDDVDLGGGDVVDDLRISVGRTDLSGYFGLATITAARPNGTPYLAWMRLNQSILPAYVAGERGNWSAKDAERTRGFDEYFSVSYWIDVRWAASYNYGGPFDADVWLAEVERHVDNTLVRVALHEIGHCLGIGTGWAWRSFRGSGGSFSFTGPLAIQAFDEAGGSSYGSDKIPLDFASSHWRREVFTKFDKSLEALFGNQSADDYWECQSRSGGNPHSLRRCVVDLVDNVEPYTAIRGEVMSEALVLGSYTEGSTPFREGPGPTRPIDRLSAITVAALADLGYEVDLSRADPYTLPESPLLPAGKVVAAGSPPLVCGVGHVAGPPWAP